MSGGLIIPSDYTVKHVPVILLDKFTENVFDRLSSTFTIVVYLSEIL